jgi:hypothetical protein
MSFYPRRGEAFGWEDLKVVAQGEELGGVHWSLKAGGSADSYYTFIETIHADQHRDEGGMGGPALYPDHLLNIYTGRADQGPLRVIVRSDPRVLRLLFYSEMGERCDLLANASDPAVGVNLFAILLPWTTGVVAMHGLDADGQLIAP